ncbi:MAG: hypothetical protein WCV99_06920 [Sterolibacterium sp.]|jgi:hypothetical protein
MWSNRKTWALALVVGLPLQGMAEESKKIQDNSFLLEEAYNQEAGVVQHIQNFMYTKKSQDWVYTFTQEWPFPDETHQLSYSIPVVRMTDPINASGVGDIALNYRYQAVMKDDIAFSPRLSVILPTGDYKKGHGTGATGLQVNLPMSLELSDKFVTHWNLGATYTAHSREPGGTKASTTGLNYGASLIYLSTENFNLMLEAAGTRSEVVQPDGSKVRERTFFINPGIRFAKNYSSGLQIVPGISIPIGVGPSSGEYGILFYLSLEHPFK